MKNGGLRPMKKILLMLLVLMMLLTTFTAWAEGVVIISSPESENATTSCSLDDMQLDAEVDLGNRIYTLYKADIQDKFTFSNDRAIKSDDTYDYVGVWIQVFNFSNQPQIYFKNAKVVVTYESERGKFEFGGLAYQDQQKDNYYWTSKPENFFAVSPLKYGYYFFLCGIPNYALNTTGELRMDITDGQQIITYYFRK
jgi:hypothetical protein